MAKLLGHSHSVSIMRVAAKWSVACSSLIAAIAHAQTAFIDDYVPQPAYSAQTRAPLATQSPRLTVTTLVSGLTRPWAVEFLPDGRMLLAELPGRIRIVEVNGELSTPLAGLPAIRAYGSQGLHDIALDPEFADNRWVYFSYMAAPPGNTGAGSDEEYELWTQRFEEAGESGAPRGENEFGTRKVGRARLSEDQTRFEDSQVIFEAPVRRMVFGPDRSLFATTVIGGAEDTPQQMDSRFGKVLRFNPDGSIPNDNPWVGEPGVDPALFAVGFRDPQGADINPRTGELWTVENGPRGGDELNIIRAGRNYGWPVISYGRNYDTQPIGDGIAVKEGMEQPLYFWSPSIAPSDMVFYTGDLIPQWQGNVLVGALAGEHLARLVLVGDQVVAEERLFVGFEDRIRDVRQSPDGAVILATDNGKLLKLTPKPPPPSP